MGRLFRRPLPSGEAGTELVVVPDCVPLGAGGDAAGPGPAGVEGLPRAADQLERVERPRPGEAGRAPERGVGLGERGAHAAPAPGRLLGRDRLRAPAVALRDAGGGLAGPLPALAGDAGRPHARGAGARPPPARRARATRKALPTPNPAKGPWLGWAAPASPHACGVMCMVRPSERARHRPVRDARLATPTIRAAAGWDPRPACSHRSSSAAGRVAQGARLGPRGRRRPRRPPQPKGWRHGRDSNRREETAMAAQQSTRVSSLRDSSSLTNRPEWLSPRDIAEVFGVGKSKSYEICATLPHIYVGRNIRVHRLTVLQEFREKGCLP
ncbi:hypothetical protein [Olsenella sp. Marseille-P4559]|uniref:hypothetical protein n=1 Tax=Olsenella sp. Marseille-P4559 TaxID=2364795 RepID=UPI00102FAF00|nr:hypothetical protein [Olsenella sp. Marseille-P4559]